MRQKIKKIVILSLFLAAVLTLSGCWPLPSSEKVGEKIIEKTIESQTGGKVDINADKESMTISSNEGNTTFSGEGEAKLPDKFPSDIFVMNDAKIVMASTIKEGNSYSISYGTDIALSEAYSKYKSEMAGMGWTNENEIDMGAQGKMLSFNKGNRNVAVTMGISNSDENKGKTTILVVTSSDESAVTVESEASGEAVPE